MSNDPHPDALKAAEEIHGGIHGDFDCDGTTEMVIRYIARIIDRHCRLMEKDEALKDIASVTTSELDPRFYDLNGGPVGVIDKIVNTACQALAKLKPQSGSGVPTDAPDSSQLEHEYDSTTDGYVHKDDCRACEEQHTIASQKEELDRLAALDRMSNEDFAQQSVDEYRRK